MIGKVIGIAVMFGLFFLMCYLGTGGDTKNMNSYYSYPDAVQQKIQENAELKARIPAEKSLLSSYVSNVVLFTVVFVIAGLLLHLHSFSSAFVYFLIAGEGLNLFDLLIIDACWWRNTARTRFAAVPDPELYRDMRKHIGSFCRGIPVFVIAALLASLLLTIL